MKSAICLIVSVVMGLAMVGALITLSWAMYALGVTQ